MKKCSRCKQEKLDSDFCKDRRTGSGLQGWCKTCHVEYQQSPAGKESQRKRDKKHSQTLKGKATAIRKTRKRKERFPEKFKAVQAVRNAIQTGKLTRPLACPSCDVERFVEAHHEDYNKPLDVKWLCQDCHRILHREVVGV